MTTHRACSFSCVVLLNRAASLAHPKKEHRKHTIQQPVSFMHSMLAAKVTIQQFLAQILSLCGSTTPIQTTALPLCRSVPSGRVGNAKDAIFRSNDHFRQAVAEREDCDVAELQHRLDRSLEKAERARIGVGQLRRFLEQLLQRRSVLSLSNGGCWKACRDPAAA